MTRLTYLDIETYCDLDLKTTNVYRYVTHPSFLILMLAYAVNDEPVRIVTEPRDILRVIEEAVDRPGTIVAHNAPFERVCFSAVLGMDVGRGEVLDPGKWDDTMALAGEKGYPQKLEPLAQALGGEEKDSAGTRLINTFSKKSSRLGRRILPEERPEDWADFCLYCIQDVVATRDIYRKISGWPTMAERATWIVDQKINDRGIKMDRALALAAAEAAEVNAEEQRAEVIEITGVSNPGSTVQLAEWFESQGVELPNLRAETVDEALERDDLTTEVRRVLELRKELALVASKKYLAALDRIGDDDRLRGSLQFFGAHTGRWAGRGVQLQNLPRETIKADDGEDLDSAIAAAALDVTLGLGGDATTLKALVRASFLGPFAVVDYSAIEARVVAWLAGEEWALEAFRAGRDIYVETAERMSTESRKMERREGKVAVLALGYNGGIGSLEAMGATGTKPYLQSLVTQWRNANPAIVDFWAEMDNAFKYGGPVGEHIVVEREGNSRFIRLPSGRAIAYHRVGQKWVTKTWPSGDKSRVRQISFVDPKFFPRRTDTYGGRLTENVTQAVARDVLAEALVRLDGRGYDVVGHIHDEILVETDDPADVERISNLMTVSPKWADGLPIDAEGFWCPRYRKG